MSFWKCGITNIAGIKIADDVVVNGINFVLVREKKLRNFWMSCIFEGYLSFIKGKLNSK
ncbi:hypothetical protein THOM_2467 [Trachipleistophora hominis]|uniref:Uncharacterized protein n=1 Tax=Trachipleistophora hominis TaxID=72359 RepID=L7JSZ6_TRAHO|nr:hypothetical protein THOM_2467 [Trachipleistophora hominis]